MIAILPSWRRLPRSCVSANGILRISLAVILVSYAIYLYVHFVPVFSDPDAIGYHLAARNLRECGTFAQVPTDDLTFIPWMWVTNDRGEYYSKYPPYYPMLAGAAGKIFGEQAELYVNPFCAWLAVLGMFLLARHLDLESGALFAAFGLAVNPVFNSYAIRQDSHPASMVLLLWGYLCLFSGMKAEGVAKNLSLSFAAGFLAAAAVGVRYSDVLMFLPPLYLSTTIFSRKKTSTLCGFLAGLLAPIIFLLIYHWRAFGSPFRTGYALTAEQNAFSGTFSPQRILLFSKAILETGLGPLALLCLFGIFILWRRMPGRLIFFGLWIVPSSLLYSSYYWNPGENALRFLRFFLPVIAGAILLGASFFDDLVRRIGWRFTSAILVASLCIQGVWGIVKTHKFSEPFLAEQRRFQEIVRTVKSKIPQGSFVIGSHQLLNFLVYTGEYGLYLDDIFLKKRLESRVAMMLKPGPRPVQRIRGERLEALNNLPRPAYDARMEAVLSRLVASGKNLFLVGEVTVVHEFKSAYSRFLMLETVCEWIADTSNSRQLLPPERAISEPTPETAQGAGHFQIVRIRMARE